MCKMGKGKKQGLRFYSEMIIVTVLSLVAASLWIDYVKGIVTRHFENHPTAILISAILVTLLAIGVLHLVFTHLMPHPDAN